MLFYLLSFLVCAPLGLWLFRFWFEDFDTFTEEFGYRERDTLSWQLIWTSLNDAWWHKLIFGVTAPYLIASVLLALSLKELLA